MPHIALLGDSILDNGAYTGGGPDVVSQVRERLPPGWSTTLLAVDGSTTRHVAEQLTRVTPQTTHLVLSVGGNNALGHIGVLDVAVPSVGHATGVLADVVSDFEQRYRGAVAACSATSLTVVACTIYNGWFEPSFQRLATTIVALFNDVIIRVAAEHSLDVVDLRSICNSAEDYANAVEPSSAGGAKIAQAIVTLICRPRSEARFEFLVDSYRTERLKMLSVWSQIPDERMGVRPEPRARTPLEHMVHQCLSEDAWLRGMLEIATTRPPLPTREARLDFLHHYAACSLERLRALESKPDEWFERETMFFDVSRTRAWVLVRRMTHSAHHRGQLTAYLRAWGRDLYSTYGPTADTGGLVRDGARVVYRYSSLEELLEAESRGGGGARLPGVGAAPPTERP